MAVLTWWLDGGAKLPPKRMDAMFRRLVDSFEIPRGEPAPAVIEIRRPIGKTQSRQIKSDSLKAAAG
jgi:hypothetical protein